MGVSVYELHLPARLDAEPTAQELLAQALGAASVPVRVRKELSLMLEELLVNVARYAYPTDTEDPFVDVRIRIDKDEGIAEVTLTDAGIPFDPFDGPVPERPTSVEDAKIGGLGIVLVRKLSDSCDYRREDAMNKTRFFKLWGADRTDRADRASEDAKAPKGAELAARLDDKDLDAVVGGIAAYVPSRPNPGVR